MPQDQNFLKDVQQQATPATLQKPNDFIIGVPEEYYLTQRDNKLHPSVTCFPTSMAMSITYILSLLGKTKQDIGVGLTDPDEQIEDYITKSSVKSTMLQWMVKAVGSWTRQYFQKAWTVAKMEEKIFDDMLRQFGFDAVFVDNVKFDEACDMLVETNLPLVISGDYRSVSSVGGHMNCVVGCNRPNRELINNDPFGYAYDGYKTQNGARVRYKWNDFYKRGTKNGEPTTWVIKFIRTS